MDNFRRCWILGILASAFCALLLPAADSLTIRVPIRWIGAAPASVVHVDRLDAAGNIAGTLDTVPSGSVVELPPATGAAKYRFRADGFTPVDLVPERLPYGAILRAYGLVEIGMPERTDAAAPGKLTVHVIENGKEQRGVTLTVEPGPGGAYSFRCPPGVWHILIDDGAGEPRMAEGVRVPPGETARIPAAAANAGRARTFRVKDGHGVPVPEASFQWSAKPGTPADALLRKWVRSRGIRTSADGRVRIDRMPARLQAWEVLARGFRTKSLEVRDGTEKTSSEREPPVEVSLRRLPSLDVRLRGAGEAARGTLTLRRLPRTVAETLGAHGVAPVWTGEIAPHVVVPALTGGAYRAEARVNGLVAVADADVDESDAGADVQELVIEILRRVVTGRVAKAGSPAGGVSIEAVPADSTTSPDTSRLAADTTDVDGGYRLSFCYRGPVLIFAASGTASKAKEVDLSRATEAEANFDFRPGRLRLHAADAASGEPLPSVDLAIEFVPAGESSEGIRSGQTDAAGDFLVDDLREGFLKIKAQRAGYAGRVLRDIAAPADGESAVQVDLVRRASFRVRVLDEFGAAVSGAEVHVPQDLRALAPRLTPLKMLGRTNDAGELLLDDLRGEQSPAWAVASGYSAETFWLPASAEPGADVERNTADVVLTHYRIAPGIVLRSPAGRLRDDALVVFQKDGIEVPLSLLARAAWLNGQSPESVFQRGDHAIHYHELLAPGTYVAEVLSPKAEADYDPAREFRDILGTVVLPLRRTAELLWKEDRPYPPDPSR
jgi:hypothetical protein